jgi:hypothetical protein
VSTSVVDVLRDQHRRIAELFERVASPDEDRPAVLGVLIRELTAHIGAERAAIGPVIHDNGPGDDISGWLGDQHDRMENLLVLIERRKFNSPDLPDLVSELKAVAGEHSERAEGELFPRLSADLTPEEQRDLADKVAREDGIITSHPHPHLLSLGPFADVLTRMASKWDRARDRTAVNRQRPEDEGKVHAGRAARVWTSVRGGRAGNP